MGGNWKLLLETAVAAHFLALEAIFAGGSVTRLRKSTIFTVVELQADRLPACEMVFGPPGKTLFPVVTNVVEFSNSSIII